MSILWFIIGFFVGGTVGGMLMAAASVAKRSDYFGPEQLLASAFEGTDVSEQSVNYNEDMNKLSGYRDESVSNPEDGSHHYFLVSREG